MWVYHKVRFVFSFNYCGFLCCCCFLLGETALLRACIKNDVEKVKHLLKEPGVDITLSDYCGWTPLHEAALRGHVKCIKLLLNHNTQSNRGTLSSYFKKGTVIVFFILSYLWGEKFSGHFSSFFLIVLECMWCEWLLFFFSFFSLKLIS